jgi:signal transduction histidine kinase
LLLAAVTVTYAVGIALIERHSRALHAWADTGWPFMHTWAAAECFASRGKLRSHRLAYLVLVAANIVSVGALVYWSYAELVRGVVSPFPTPADFAFLGYTPAYALAIFLMCDGACSRSLSLRVLGDLGISIATMFFVGMLIYYDPSVESRLPASTLAVALAYPILSLSATAFGLLSVLQQLSGPLRSVIAIHFCALTAHATAYTLYGAAIMTGRYEVGKALDPMWFGGCALTVWAAREDRWLSAGEVKPRPSTAPSVLDAVFPASASALLVLTIGVFRDQLPRVPVPVVVMASSLFVVSLAVRGVAVRRLERELTTKNAELLEIERATRAAQELLSHASALLSETLESDRVLSNVARLVVSEMPGWCLVELVEGGRIRRAAAEHSDPAKRALLEEFVARFPLTANGFTGQAMRLGRPIALTAEILESWCEGDHDRLHLLRALGTDSGFAAPFVARGRMLGALGVASSSHRFTTVEQKFLIELTQRAAIAIDNAQLFRQSREALRMREEFIQLASHELNTPVTALMLHLESALSRLRRGSVEPEDMLRMAALMERRARNVADLVGDLTDVAQREQEWVSLRTRPVELTGLIREALERARPRLDRASCELRVDLGPPVTGSWDPLRIEQVVEKLLANAAKFGAGKPIEVKLEALEPVVCLSIADQGIGIDPSAQDRIFGRFERGVSATHFGGLGLGLYICRRIVEAHRGSIRAESRPGGGARFVVELPIGAINQAVDGAVGDGEAP